MLVNDGDAGGVEDLNKSGDVRGSMDVLGRKDDAAVLFGNVGTSSGDVGGNVNRNVLLD